MSLPVVANNIVGSHVYPILDLGMTAGMASAASPNVGTFSTGLPATVLIVCSLVSGSGDMYVSVADTVADLSYASPAASGALSGTSQFLFVVNTTDNANLLNNNDSGNFDTYVTPTQALIVGIEVTTAATILFNQFAILSLCELTAGEDWFSVAAGGINAVAGTYLGDGSGVINLAVA